MLSRGPTDQLPGFSLLFVGPNLSVGKHLGMMWAGNNDGARAKAPFSVSFLSEQFVEAMETNLKYGAVGKSVNKMGRDGWTCNAAEWYESGRFGQQLAEEETNIVAIGSSRAQGSGLWRLATVKIDSSSVHCLVLSKSMNYVMAGWSWPPPIARVATNIGDCR